MCVCLFVYVCVHVCLFLCVCMVCAVCVIIYTYACRWLIPRLHDIPILLVAMTTDNPTSLVKEGEQFCANLKKGSFVSCRDQIPSKED